MDVVKQLVFSPIANSPYPDSHTLVYSNSTYEFPVRRLDEALHGTWGATPEPAGKVAMHGMPHMPCIRLCERSST